MSETKQYYEGDENPEKPISGADIKTSLIPDDVLEKYPDDEELKRAINQCSVSQEIATTLARRDNTSYHIIRMLRRSKTERAFCLAFLQHYNDENIPDKNKIRAVINSEGADTVMFWTFAPYLFKALIKKGVSERDAISKILSWSKDGVSSSTESLRPYGTEIRDCNKLHLKGLVKYQKAWILDIDTNHVSHKYTEQEAEHIADLLIAENDEK